jgi:hypothetical protein
MLIDLMMVRVGAEGRSVDTSPRLAIEGKEMKQEGHPQKITFAEMRDMGVQGLLVYCADYRCSHSIAISGDGWPDDVRLSDIEHRFVCEVCGKRGADVRPDFNWDKMPAGHDGY